MSWVLNLLFHRADFMYMVPPFIAYYGALQGKDGADLLQIAYTQSSLYRDALRDKNGLWRHVTLGSWQDNTFVHQHLTITLILEVTNSSHLAATGRQVTYPFCSLHFDTDNIPLIIR
jgi:hypothetical protein